MKGSELDDESTYLYSLHLFSKGDNSGARKLLENIKGEEEIVRKAYYALACYYYVEDPFTASVWLEALNDMTENLELKIFSFILLGICKLKLGEHKSALHNLDAAENFMSNFSKEYLRLFRYAYIWAVHLSGNTSEALAMLKKLSEKDFEFIDIAESYTMGTNDGFKEVEKVVMSRLDEFPRPTILSALSEYGGITYEKIEEIFRKWRLGFKNTSGFKWVISVKDFQELKFQEFIEVSRQLPELFDYRIEKEIPSTQGFSALVVDKTGERSVIDIFPWGSTVSDIAIKELSVVMDENNVSKGIIIVPGQFSKKARTEAGVYNIKLVDKDELQAVMNTK
jgi:tetratricopeptide (TPR) repeat protein